MNRRRAHLRPQRSRRLPAAGRASVSRTSRPSASSSAASTANVAVAAARLGRTHRDHHRRRRRPLRPVRPPGARPARRRRPLRRPRPRVPDAGDLLRDLPAGRLPALLLPPPEGARPAGRPPRTWTLDAIRDAGVFWVTGDRPERGAEPRGAPRRAAMPATGARTPCSTSTTARCSGRSRRRRTEQVQKVLRQVTVAVGNREECEVAVGETDPDARRRRPAGRRRRAGRRQAGPQGRARQDPHRTGRVRRRSRSTSSTASAPATPSAAPSPTACSPGWPLEELLLHANAAGAIVASRLECSTAMPTAGGDRRAARRAGRSTTMTRLRHDVAELTEIRARHPERVAELLAAGARRACCPPTAG